MSELLHVLEPCSDHWPQSLKATPPPTIMLSVITRGITGKRWQILCIHFRLELSFYKVFRWYWASLKVDIQLSGLKLLIYLHYYQITACPQLTQTIHSLLVTCRRKDSGLQKDDIDIIFLEYARHHTPRFNCIVAAWGCLLNTKSRVLLASEADTSKTVNKLVSLTTV